MKFPRMNQTNDHSELWQFSSIMKRMDTYLEKRYAVIAGYGWLAIAIQQYPAWSKALKGVNITLVYKKKVLQVYVSWWFNLYTVLKTDN